MNNADMPRPYETSSMARLPEPQHILLRYRKFNNAFRSACKKNKTDVDGMPFVDLTRNMSDWLKINQMHPPAPFL